MLEGTVKFFNTEKGYGFITASNTNQDIFVHNSGLIHEIIQDDKVSFETEQGRKGLNAINVERID